MERKGSCPTIIVNVAEQRTHLFKDFWGADVQETRISGTNQYLIFDNI
jgi:hypothetical protein